MPTYEYACKSCGERLEVQQRFSDDPLTECPACKGELRKVFGNVGIAFKGSGFYKTDSRGGSSKSASTTTSSDSSSSTSTSSTSTDKASSGSTSSTSTTSSSSS
jgi:putative FmdB family regulatory protein